MNSKTFWTWMFFTTMSAMLLFPALMPEIAHRPSPSVTPTPASYTLPFTPIVNNAENPVGNLTIVNAYFIEGYQYYYGNISLKWRNGTFNQTTTFARQDTSTGTGDSRTGDIQFSWHEYLEISKSDLISNPWFNYSSRVPDAQLNSVEYNNSLGWGSLVTAPASFYQYSHNESYTPHRNFLNLSLANMNDAWKANITNGTVCAKIKYSYHIPISKWQVLENSTTTALPNMTNTITQTYYETFQIQDSDLISGTPLLNVTLAYVPFYGNGVVFNSLWNRSAGSGAYQQVPGGKYKINLTTNSMNFTTNASSDYQIFFNANFTIQFDQPLNLPDIYAVDRLASDIDIREHWYYVKVTGGPNLLRIANLKFNDTNVAYADTIGTSTYFGRVTPAWIKDWNNITIVTDDTTNEINNGTTLTGGYWVSGETDVVMLSYRATRNLTILIADQIVTPVPGASVTLFRDGVRFGSYLSRLENFTQPPKLADERGVVVFTNLPSSGNYSISLDLAGTNYGIYYVDVYKTPNLLTTRIPHFPTWIIIWASFCAIITLFGFSKFKRYRNVPVTLTP